jgi:hypothetical protein
MDLVAAVLNLGLFSKIYILSMCILFLTYFFRSLSLHSSLRLSRVSSGEARQRTLNKIEAHLAGLRQAEHIALGLGRALFAAQLSNLLLVFSPIMRGTDIQPWLDVPNFVIICQLCFLPTLLLLSLDWLLACHLRRITLLH